VEHVLRALALRLGLPNGEFLLKYHDESRNDLGLRHYPPVKESVINSGEMDRLEARCDVDSFTLLW
jgi:isopenicillin N synthase-like dioxygenase